MIDEEIITAGDDAPHEDASEEATPVDNETEVENAEDTAIAEETVMSEDEVDYAALAAADLAELKGQFPELCTIENIAEIDNPLRYAALRDLGLTPREAYLATNERHHRADNRAHLSAAVPKGAGTPKGGMSREELYRARELFGNMSDTELQSLYRKVNA